MLNKLFGKKKKPNNLSLTPGPKRASAVPPGLSERVSQAYAIPSGTSERVSRAVKIIHPGGHAEYHYMAMPAGRIIEKYPGFILARPDIFKRPLGSIVRPDEILVPGQKFYIVPRQTVKKLRRRIKRNVGVNPGQSRSFVDENDSRSNISVSGIMVKPGPKDKARKDRHVRFFGVDNTNKKSDSAPGHSAPSDGKKGNKVGKGSKERPMNPHKIEKERRARNENGWEPSLNSIQETLYE